MILQLSKGGQITYYKLKEVRSHLFIEEVVPNQENYEFQECNYSISNSNLTIHQLRYKAEPAPIQIYNLTKEWIDQYTQFDIVVVIQAL